MRRSLAGLTVFAADAHLAAGHWSDAASAEHGDLLDVIRERAAASSTFPTSPRRRGAF
jgi:hypothetical protein